MSATPLTVIEDSIEKSIFEALRLEMVDKFLTPDITTYNLATDQLLWESDLKALSTTNPHGFVAELFGASGYQANNTKKAPRIVIDPQGFFPGELGGDTTRIYQQATPGPGNPYNGLARPPRSANYFVNIHIVANTIKQLRILQALTALSLPRRGYIKFYNEPTFTFSGNLYIENIAFLDLPQTQEGVMEKVYRFMIADVFEQECIVAAVGGAPILFAPINTINIDNEVDGGDTTTFTTP